MPRRSEPTVPTLPLDEPALPGTEAADTTAPDTDAIGRFEHDMQELESIVAQMERGDLRLEDALRLFERGTQLARGCRASLDTAELKIRTLLGDAGDTPDAP